MTAATVGAAKDAAKAKAKEEAMKEMAKVVPGLTGCQGFCAKFDDGMFCVKKPAIFFLYFCLTRFNIFCLFAFVLLFFCFFCFFFKFYPQVLRMSLLHFRLIFSLRATLLLALRCCPT